MVSISHRKQVERARRDWDKASDAFNAWAIANGLGSVKYNDMAAAIASHPQQPRGADLFYHSKNMRTKLTLAEDAAVDAGKAWRGTFGLLSWYHNR